MIDAQDMAARHLKGLQQIGSLESQELLALQLYCQKFAEETADDGQRRGASVEALMINAVKNGIAIGLCLQVVSGEVQGRE